MGQEKETENRWKLFLVGRMQQVCYYYGGALLA